MVANFVVIPVKDRHQLTAELLATLGQDDGAYETILLFDNDSDQPVRHTKLLSVAPRTELIEQSGLGVIYRIWNQGANIAAGRTRGASHNVIFLNNDIIVEPDFLRRLTQALRSANDLAIVYPNYDARSHAG